MYALVEQAKFTNYCGEAAHWHGCARRQLSVYGSKIECPICSDRSTRFGHPCAIDQRLLSGISNAETELTIGVVGPQLLSPST
jgi:hypothetical protein